MNKVLSFASKLKARKNIILILIIILAFIVTFLIYYSNKYSISSSNESITNYLISKNYISGGNLSIQKQADIKNTKIVIFYDGYRLQYVLLKKGLNGKYSFMYIASMNSSYYSYIEEIQGNYYLISLGCNSQKKSYINITLNYSDIKRQEVIFSIKGEKFFIKYKVLNNQSEKNYRVSDYYLKD